MATVTDWAFEHPVLAVFALAFSVRLVTAVIALAFVDIDRIAPDAIELNRLAREKAAGDTGSWTLVEDLRFDHFGTYLIPLTALYKVFGPHLILGQILSALGGAGAAAAVCALLLRVTARRWALIGGAVVALLPSQVVFSSVALRDGPVWGLTAVLALVVTFACSATGRRLFVLGVGLGALLFLLGHLRFQTVVVAGYALVLASVFSAFRGRLSRVAGAVLLAFFVPWMVGVGPAGIDFVRNRDLGEIRALNAAGADSGFVDETPHLEGEVTATRGIVDDLKHLPRGLSVMLLEPVPWSTRGSGIVQLARAELLLWYPLLALAVLGLGTAWRDRSKLAFPVFFAGGMITLYALAEGNLGTAYRHRGEATWALACLAALGCARAWAWHTRGFSGERGRSPMHAAPTVREVH